MRPCTKTRLIDTARLKFQNHLNPNSLNTKNYAKKQVHAIPARTKTKAIDVNIIISIDEHAIEGIERRDEQSGVKLWRKNYLYKTQMCAAYEANRKCDFHPNCHFAHGDAELRLNAVPEKDNLELIAATKFHARPNSAFVSPDSWYVYFLICHVIETIRNFSIETHPYDRYTHSDVQPLFQ